MTSFDLDYFRHCAKLSLLKSPFLEVGSAKVENAAVNLCDVARELGVKEVLGADLDKGQGVDLTCDFSVSAEEFAKRWTHAPFGTVGIFNVLEHTYEPAQVLRNAVRCVRPGGTLLVVVPTVWPIHHFPKDYVRLLPDWFEEFAVRYQLTVVPEAFCWLSEFGLLTMKEHWQIPNYQSTKRGGGSLRYWASRLAHTAFHTFGKSHWATHAAIGIAYRVPE